jgi:hypothetical protein
MDKVVDTLGLASIRKPRMSRLLKRAFEKASRLPSEEQDRFGAWMLAELNSEERWSELFARSPELLKKLADEAIAEHNAGLTEPLDLENL